MRELFTGFGIAALVSYLILFVAFMAFGLTYYAWTNTLAGRARIIVAWGVPTAVVVACCSMPLGLPILLHNFQLFQLEQRLYAYPLPPDTQVINRESAISRHTGNGNYCIFTVRQSMSTMLSKSEVSAHYATTEVPGISHYPNSIWVEFSGRISSAGELEYMIEINDMTDRFFDIRC